MENRQPESVKSLRSLLNSSCFVDLYGLTLFLGADPYWVKYWWDQLLYRPYRRGNTEPLYNVIAQILWRSAKKDVIDQVLFLRAPRRLFRQLHSN